MTPECDPGQRPVTEDDAVPGVKNVVLVMSGKGGVGKSTVAVNLAVALRRLGSRVGLLDADIHGPSLPTMMGEVEALVSDGKQIIPAERYGIKLMSIGYLLEDPKTAIIWRGPMVHGALVQFLKDVAWGDLDFLILDLPPGTGDVALTLTQRMRCNGAVMVTTPQQVALQDVFKAVTMCQKLGLCVLGVVENQSYFTCDHGQRYELFGSGGGQEVARLAGAPLLGQIPIDPRLREAGDTGKPLVETAPDSPIGQVFLGIAQALATRIAEENARSGGRLGTVRDERGRPHLPVMR
jgi:ATP-binding protein involved in chromosome partitioning